MLSDTSRAVDRRGKRLISCGRATPRSRSLQDVTFSLTFGRDGDAQECLGAGWSAPEQGCTWTDGHVAELMIPRPPKGDYVLLLRHGVYVPPTRMAQRVAVRLGKTLLEQYIAETGGDYRVRIPAAAVADAPDPMLLRLELPDAARPPDHGRPNDLRKLALSLRGLSLALRDSEPAADVQTFIRSTESLGCNCEFGFIQRKLGIEPISLLRWAGAPTDGLISALRNNFAGLMEEAIGHATPPRREPADQRWWLSCRRYDILFHTNESVAAMTADEAADKARRRLRWLAGKLMTDLREAEKIFVYSSAAFATPADGDPLVRAVRESGGTAWLVLVGEGADGPPRYLGDRVWWATLPRLTKMMQANTADEAAWLSLLRDMAVHVPAMRPPPAPPIEPAA